MLTTFAEDETIIAALKAGARGYPTKNADRREISQALHSAAAGHTILPPDVTAMLLAGADSAGRPSRRSAAELPDDLTPREAEVLKLLAAGLSNGEIARDLFISEHTVKTHINHLFGKTNSRDRAQAIRYAHEHELAERAPRARPSRQPATRVRPRAGQVQAPEALPVIQDVHLDDLAARDREPGHRDRRFPVERDDARRAVDQRAP